MATIAQTLPSSSGRFAWLGELLRSELAPYRGRLALVTRMVIASTLVMIVSMTFRIPDGAYGAIYAFTLSRTSLEATASAVRSMAIGLGLGGAYVIVGAMLVLDDPTLRFLWVVGTLFLTFYLISATSNFGAAARFGYLVVITIPLWDRHIPSEQKVEGTLWAVGAITLASVATLLLEIVFAAFKHTDDLIDGITERLASVEELLTDYADDRRLEAATDTAVTRLAIVGTSRLRRMLHRSAYGPQAVQQMGAVLALVGRLVDLAANLAQFTSHVPDIDRDRIGKVAQSIAVIRADLFRATVPRPTQLPGEDQPAPGLPLLREIERTVSQIPEIFTSSQSLSIYATPSDGNRRTMPLVPGALSNPEHLKFALRGCFAATLCYVAYNALFWPEISTAVTTCLLTALTTVGSSHQKQVLRFAGALVGGLGIGMGAQIFILPNIDSIGGFTVLFAAVASATAWIATSSPRLSYFGVQMYGTFCLINLQEFKIQTSLTIARDRVVGILLGLFAMWLFFDHFWSTPAAVAMKKAFISNLRLLAQFAREPISKDTRIAIERSYALREEINTQFDKMRSLADGVLFEFGPSRQRDLALRDQIRRWQPRLRTLFVMRIASWKYRLPLPGFELPDAARVFQADFDGRSARILDEMADRIESLPAVNDQVRHPEPLTKVSFSGEVQDLLTPQLRSFDTLLRGIDTLTTSLWEEIATEFDPSAHQLAATEKFDREPGLESA